MSKVKRVIGIIILVGIVFSMMACQEQSDYTSNIYFDLEFENEEAVNVGKNKKHTTISSCGEGEVATIKAVYQGQVCEVPAYVVQQSSDTDSYLEITFDNIKDTEDMQNWIFAKGITFECFLYVEQEPNGNYGILSNTSKGGVGLYGKGLFDELNFSIGTTDKKTVTYRDGKVFATAAPSPSIYTSESAYYSDAKKQQTLDGGCFTHVVGVYDAEANQLSVYKNGTLIGTGDYSENGQENFEIGSALLGQLGLGANIANPKEALDNYTDYAIVDARVYSCALTSEDVKQQYQLNCETVLSHSAEGYESVTQLDDLSVYNSVSGKQQELVGQGFEVPSYVYGEHGLGIYKGSKEGESTTPESADILTHVFGQTANTAYLSYLKALENHGWTQYSNNIIEGKNLFATYTKDGHSIYAYYLANLNETRIVCTQNAVLENRAQDNHYEKKCDTLFTQINLQGINWSTGNSYLLRLSDGRFVVIDGGWYEEDNMQTRDLYDLMDEQNVLDEITVAAWIISHPHSDHLGTAGNFLKTYSSEDLVIEEMIFNFPTQKDTQCAEPAMYGSNTKVPGSRVLDFWDSLKTYWPDMKIVTCHTGQEYYFADVTLEFLFTIEDYYPKSVADFDFQQINGSSAIFTIEVEGQKIIMLGDCNEVESNSLVKVWGDYVKCDIMQASHHSLGGGTIALYETIDPKVVLVPSTLNSSFDRSSEYWQYNTTYWVFDQDYADTNIKEVINAGLGTRSLKLPYEPAEDVEYLSNREQNGFNFKEPKETETELPQPYMDLQFSDGSVTNCGTANISVDMFGTYSIGKNTVYYKDTPYEVISYRAEKQETADQCGYLKVVLEDLKSQEDFTNFVMNGCTFEVVIALDSPIQGNCTFMGNSNTGGVSLLAKEPYGSNFFVIGNTSQTGRYCDEYFSSSTKLTTHNTCTIAAGQNVMHIIGIYDAEDNMLRLYQNGVLIRDGSYGEGSMQCGDALIAAYNELGIGMNAGSSEEGQDALALQTGFTMLRARIYGQSLTDEQVAAEYWDCISQLTE